MYIIVVYDINVENEGAKILSKIYKICKKYLCHIQNSVFEGEISDSNLLKFKLEIKKLIRSDRDSFIIFNLRNKKWLSKEFWGFEDDKTSNFI